MEFNSFSRSSPKHSYRYLLYSENQQKCYRCVNSSSEVSQHKSFLRGGVLTFADMPGGDCSTVLGNNWRNRFEIFLLQASPP